MMATNTDKSFLGTGWSFPPSFQLSTKDLVLTSGEEDIKRSLEILLSTTIGERFLQPLYGCNLEQYVFEPLNATISTEIRLTVKNAIELYEPRLKLLAVKLGTEFIMEGRIDIVVEYDIIATNTRHNLVYPFYINEAHNKTA
jgi:phage baseplate assembly protein W